jgi:hypothetical protein
MGVRDLVVLAVAVLSATTPLWAAEQPAGPRAGELVGGTFPAAGQLTSRP